MTNTSLGISYSILSLKSSLTWVLDTGPINHVCHYKTYFQTLVNIAIIMVKLPNVATITTNQIGTIKLNYDFYLSDVLCIPSFFTNLIYVPRLIKSLNCKVTFNFVIPQFCPGFLNFQTISFILFCP